MQEPSDTMTELQALARKHHCDIEDIVYVKSYKGPCRREKVRRYVDREAQQELQLTVSKDALLSRPPN